MKNKKALSFKLVFFALVAFSILIVAVGNWVTEWNEDYDSGITYDLGGLNKLDDVSGEAEDMQSGISIKSTNTGEEFEGTSIRGVFGVLNNIFKPFRIVLDLLDSLVTWFGIPPYLKEAFITIMIMSITFTLVGIFFRLNRRNI